MVSIGPECNHDHPTGDPACAQDGCKARDTEKSEVQGPAHGHECEEIRGQEKAAKKPFCPMTRSLHPLITAYGHRVRFAGTWREEFFEAPLGLSVRFDEYVTTNFA